MPLEQIGQPLLWIAGFTDGGNVKTGLAVTVNVWEFIVGGAKTQIVLGDNATEAGDGLYYYELGAGSVDEHAIYVAVFFTAGAADQQDIFADWVVGPTWVENVDDAITDVPDLVLSRDVANVEATASTDSLAELLLAAFESVIAAGTWTIYRTDHATPFNTRTVTTSAIAQPIVEVT